ncbi:MAG TPA: DUF2075 domain-containing protein [Pirellulales bacterium]|nr:DUF2075 domain-containing protein [Pirellulales bacterium]
MSASFLSSLAAFDDSTQADKLGRLTGADASRGFATHYSRQIDAWVAELGLLSRFARDCIRRTPGAGSWTVLLEFDIPRRGKRPDAILIADDLIFVIEFKIGASEFTANDQWQVLSYGLDLRDFHSASYGQRIVPILVVTGNGRCTARPRSIPTEVSESGIVLPVQLSTDAVGEVTASLVCDLYDRLHRLSAAPIDAPRWNAAAYRPTPTIIEAAQQIFAGHGVANISHAFAYNLDATCRSLLAAVRDAKERRRRAICFVTGIPGAGKTLAGLNMVHSSFFRADDNRAAVFLSGNGPLVRIVRAALVRDRRRSGQKAKDAKRAVATFIDSVHRFISDHGIKDPTSEPYENVIVFDEAQRAWDGEAVERQHGIRRSEPDLVLSAMERAKDWCAVIALVGGGQEIHRGEAGLSEWGRALNGRPAQWDVFASPAALSGGDSVAGHVLFEETPQPHLAIQECAELHLSVSVRSPRARRIAEWVNCLLGGGAAPANAHDEFGAEFPVVMTRNLDAARHWLREMAEGQGSTGILASSGALRLRADGIEVSSGFRRGYAFDEWFLADRNDTRSSNFLEVAATEFECQGLELDWTCVCWGYDFAFSLAKHSWLPRKFRGNKWQNIHGETESRYTTNKYRVLLTRARRGMVIWVPKGSNVDCTRDSSLLDATAAHLQAFGLPLIEPG